MIALGLLASCNQIFGLDDVTIAPPDDAAIPDPVVKLTYMVAGTEGAKPAMALDLDTAIPDPKAKVGALDQPLVATAYDPVTKTVRFPRALLDTKWRLEYTDETGIPHELQWKVSEAVGMEPHIVLPRFGPIAPTSPPTGSAYRITATGASAPAKFDFAHLLTAGIWMDISAGRDSANPVIAALDGVTPLSGARGTPATDDSAALVDLKVVGTCRAARGFADLRVLESNGTTQNLSALWNVQTIPVLVSYPEPPGNELLRFISTLADRAPAVATSSIQLGHGAHPLMPAFTRQDLADPSLAEPSPVMLVLEDCPYDGMQPAAFSDPLGFQAFPLFARARVQSRRVVSNATLISSMSSVSLGTNTTGTNEFAISLPGPIAHDPISLGSAILSGTDDQVSIGNGTEPLDLTFDFDKSLPVDYFEVTLLSIANGNLTPVRVYLTTDVSTVPHGAFQTIAAPIRIDRTVFGIGGEFVFAIQTHRGAPAASIGDFSQVSFPQVVATVFTRTFMVP